MDYWSKITITDIQMFHSENPIAIYNNLFMCPSDFSNFCHITLQNTGKILFARIRNQKAMQFRKDTNQSLFPVSKIVCLLNKYNTVDCTLENKQESILYLQIA